MAAVIELVALVAVALSTAVHRLAGRETVGRQCRLVADIFDMK